MNDEEGPRMLLPDRDREGLSHLVTVGFGILLLLGLGTALSVSACHHRGNQGPNARGGRPSRDEAAIAAATP